MTKGFGHEPQHGSLQKQVHNDFAPIWGVDADLAVVPKGTHPVSGSWWLVIVDDSDQAGALGYHDITSEGDCLLGRSSLKRIYSMATNGR